MITFTQPEGCCQPWSMFIGNQYLSFNLLWIYDDDDVDNMTPGDSAELLPRWDVISPSPWCHQSPELYHPSLPTSICVASQPLSALLSPLIPPLLIPEYSPLCQHPRSISSGQPASQLVGVRSGHFPYLRCHQPHLRFNSMTLRSIILKIFF